MQKVSRSIFAGLLVIAGLTACGDKVTVAPGNTGTGTGTVVHSVTVQPSSVSLKVGENVKLVATVDADAGLARTVTWASGDAAKASVGADGTVTAVAPGTVAITATSVADPTVAGAATIIVQSVTAATISIGSITKGGLPANLGGVTGQLDVTMNVDQGTQTLTELDLIVHNNTTNTDTTVAKYSFASASKAPVSATSAPVTMSFNTAAYNATTGAVSFVNGSYSIKAQAVVAGSTGQSPVSSTMNYTVANTDTMLVAAHGDTVSTDASGRQWTAGKITVSVVPVLYSGRGLLNAVVSQSGGFTDSATKTLTTFPGSAVFGVNTDTLTDSSYVAFVTAKYSDATQFNGGTPVNAPKIRVDNSSPLPAAKFVLGPDTSDAKALTPPWVNAAYTFSKGISKPIDSSLVNNQAGVGGVTTTFYAIPNDANYTALAGGVQSTWAKCAAPANAIMAATGAAITVQSAPGDTTTYRGRAVSTDKLGNVVCQDMNYLAAITVFGVDNTNPVNAALADSALDGNFGPTPASVGTFWHYVLQDSISGFSAAPISATLVWNYRITADPTTCTIGTYAAGPPATCKAVAIGQNNAVDNGTGVNGYYTMTSTISDVAGNKVVIPPATVLIDNTNPAAGAAPTVTTAVGDSAATYAGKVTDNVDLISSVGGISYPVGYTLSYPTAISPAHAAFSGVRDTTGTVTLTVANHFISSLAITSAGDAPQSTALGAATHPSFVRLYGVDGVGNKGGQDIASPAVTDTAGAQVWALSMFGTFAENNPASTGTGATLTAQTTGSSASLGVPFTNVCWYKLNTTTTYYDLLGCQNLAVATQTAPGINTWDWTGPAVARPAAGSYNIIAIGFGIGGSALASQPNTNIAH